MNVEPSGPANDLPIASRSSTDLSCQGCATMSDPDHLLCLTTSASGDEVFLHADAAGLDRLIRSLTSLRDKLHQGQSDHDHFKTPEWAGDELSTAPARNDERAVQHFKIWAWTPDKVREHGLKP